MDKTIDKRKNYNWNEDEDEKIRLQRNILLRTETYTKRNR